MTLSLSQSYTAIAGGQTSSFLAAGGVPRYIYTVLPGGAGGTIASNGVYTAPAQASSSPNQAYDTIQVTDSTSATATAQILVGTYIDLFCDILQTGMGLANGRVYLWNQKIFQPTDNGLYIAVSVPQCKTFGNNVFINYQVTPPQQQQLLNMWNLVDVDIISRGPAARDQKEQVLFAMNNQYSEQQQEKNSFFIGKVANNFVNLSMIDGAAIPYRYKISYSMQYAQTLSTPIQYYSNIPGYTLTTSN